MMKEHEEEIKALRTELAMHDTLVSKMTNHQVAVEPLNVDSLKCKHLDIQDTFLSPNMHTH